MLSMFTYFRSVLAVEAIVDPRHKAADCEQTDAHVVELAEELGHMLAVEVIVRKLTWVAC